MRTRCVCRSVVVCLLVAIAGVVPAFSATARPSVLVNPNANGNGAVSTIQQGIDLVDPGGKVMVLPGRYEEPLLIDKALTVVAIGGDSGDVIVAPPASSVYAIEVRGFDPVVIRGVHIEYSGLYAIGGAGAANLTIENVSIVGPLSALGQAVIVQNDALVSGRRARLVVRDSYVDLQQRPSTPDGAPMFQNFGIGAVGDVDSLIERNTVRRTGGGCIRILTIPTSETNADVIGNDLDECYPTARVGAVIVGPPGTGRIPVPVTATGTVNIIGNIIRNTTGSCRVSAAINYEMLTGRIEHNVIDTVVPACALPSPRSYQAGIWIGSLFAVRGIRLPPATPTVRFNDITGNAFAGLRVSPDQTQTVDATCNWWGDAAGPFGSANGVLGAAVFEPWATEPIAGTTASSCQ